MTKRAIFFGIIFLQFTTCIFADATLASLASANVRTSDAHWVLGATAFAVNGASMDNAVLQEAGASLPRLILEALSGRGMRTIEEAEIIQKELYARANERHALFAELSNCIAKKESLLFVANDGAFSNYERKKKQKDFDKQIAQIQQKIELTLNARTTSSANANAQNAGLNAGLRAGDTLPLVLYHNDSSALVSAQKSDETNFAFEKRLVDEGISGLITGTITERAGFLNVSASLTTYPYAKVVFTTSDIGDIADLQSLANALADALLPAVLNARSVKLRFAISPQEASQNARIYVDGLAPTNDNTILIQNGVHTVYIYAEGFESKQFKYAFTQTDEYKIDVQMTPKQTVAVSFSADSPSTFYTNTKEVTDAKNAQIQKGTTMGEIVDDVTGDARYFVIHNGANGANSSKPLVFKDISFSARMQDATSEIEKTRTDLYNSYALLLFSLPFSFIANGMHIATKNSSLYGRATDAKAEMWKDFATYSNVFSAALGVNMLYQLTRYLQNANKILPQTIEIE